MRVGVLGPITHALPPTGYGPWEQVTYDLVEALVAQGHDVTLFGPATSRTSADLVSTVPQPLEELAIDTWRSTEDLHIDRALAAASEAGIEIVHSHLHAHALNRASRYKGVVVSTLHGVAWNSDIHPALLRHAARPFVSLSDSERRFLPQLNYVATIPNGIHTESIQTGNGAGGYLAFVGRLAPEKAPHLAVAIARAAGWKLLMAGTIEERHRRYAENVLEALAPVGDYLGPLPRGDVYELLGSAGATLMPLDWEEPFGLVVAESLATGTPVIAWRRGAMPEIIDQGTTGFLVGDVTEAVSAVESMGELDRDSCAAAARTKFDRSRMASDYAEVYEHLLKSDERAPQSSA